MIKDRLENWARWAKCGSRLPLSCRSIEHRYKSEYPRTNEPLRADVNLLEAWETEDALVSPEYDPRDKDIIVYAYIDSWKHFDKFCSQKGIKGNKFMSKSEMFERVQAEAESKLDALLNKLKAAA